MIRPTSDRPPVEGHPVDPWDFSTLDFDRLWEGRERTTDLERRVVDEALEGVQRARVLEVGLGGGRISPILRRKFEEYVGIDVTLEFLQRRAASEPDPPPYFAADVQRLPFAPASFNAVVMVRVYNFLVDPLAALKEVARVLTPGGALVLSYHPVPSWGTLHEDLRHLLSPARPPGFAPVTLARREVHQPRRHRVLGNLRAAGFTVGRGWATGLEDYRFGRRIPLAALVPLSRLAPPFTLLPHRFVRATTGGRAGAAVPPLSKILACPSCGAPELSAEPRPRSAVTCRRCGRAFPMRSGVLDLR